MIRVLSLWQPWATLCVAKDPATLHPPKQYETRSWEPRRPFPMDVVIHATKKWDRENAMTAVDPGFRVALNRCGFLAGPTTRTPALYPNLRPLPMGALIGVATVIACYTTEWIADALSDEELLFGDYSPGRFAWRLAHVRPLPEPIPFRGRQDALYPLDDYTEELIAKQLRQLTGV
jgi:hypothetical protein